MLGDRKRGGDTQVNGKTGESWTGETGEWGTGEEVGWSDGDK